MRTSTSINSLDEIDAAQWNALRGAQTPFLRHEFLAAFEHTGCVGSDTGWSPAHILLRDDSGRLVGGMPMYRKSHSWGEFVFDFSWAEVHTRLGLSYYPKLLSAVPFTPASGPRILAESEAVQSELVDVALDLARRANLSSFHVLFPEGPQAEWLAQKGFLQRRDCQFHWHNRGYVDFAAFLATLTAEKRKKMLRERRRIAEAGITFQTLTGGEIDAKLWHQVYAFHADTFHRHGHLPYLNCEFFQEVAARMPEAVVVQLALHRKHAVAAAICFRGADTLYGRYWGAAGDFHSLHFETCYYQGIDYCIQHGLQRFEPGTQGEHKVARGFTPAYTGSAHWIADSRLRTAIADYLEREGDAVGRYAAEIEAHAPYKKTASGAAGEPLP